MSRGRLKFCMITTFYPPYNFGGDGIQVYRLSNELARRGHEVHVIHCLDSFYLFAREPIGEYPNHINVTLHPLRSGVGWLSPFLTQQTGRSWFKQKKIQTILDHHSFDVIHYHNISLIGCSAFRLGNAVKLCTLHEHWLMCPLHVLWKYNKKVCDKPTCFSCQIQAAKPPQWWRYTNLLADNLKYVDCFIAPSSFTKTMHSPLNIPTIQIPHFLPADESGPESSISTERPFFLYVGRLEKIKGVQILIEVFRKYSSADLLIAGEGGYEDFLRKAASGLKHVRFLGQLSHSLLKGYYQKTISVIVPSLCYEVFGLVVVEAFQQKTPVIVNDHSALTEIVKDSQGGLRYRNNDELVQSMEQFRLNPSLRIQFGENGYRAYQELWSADLHVERYLSLIKQLETKRLQHSRETNREKKDSP